MTYIKAGDASSEIGALFIKTDACSAVEISQLDNAALFPFFFYLLVLKIKIIDFETFDSSSTLSPL